MLRNLFGRNLDTALRAGREGTVAIFEHLLQEADTPMLVLNQDAVIQDINSPATQLLGGKREDYVGKEIFTLVDPADRYFFQERWKADNADTRTMRQFTVRLRRFQRPSDWHTLRIEAANEPLEVRLGRKLLFETAPDADNLERPLHFSTPSGSSAEALFLQARGLDSWLVGGIEKGAGEATCEVVR